MKFGKSSQSGKPVRILYGSDFHGSDVVFRKFLSASMQYKANILIVGGDVTGKAMVPVIHQGHGRYTGSWFGKEETATTPQELDKIKKNISNVGFYPIVLEKEEAEELENQPDKMAHRFEDEMCQRVQEWMTLAEEKLLPLNSTLYFMAGNDDFASIDEVVSQFQHIRNPDMAHFELEEGYEIVGCSNANMTPWLCARDIEEDQLASKLDTLAGMIHNPEHTIAVLHVPPFSSGLDTCPDLDKNLKIITEGGQVVMKSAGSTAVKAWIEKVQPMLTLHGHIHESPGHVRIGHTLAINAGSEYAEGILKAAIINLENGKVKGHLLISG
ncbi:MAG: metallophosphoesterase [Anaerolineales bacterium]|nr:MAG: metallophosphoesterase [Anaerolineales bacterium]